MYRSRASLLMVAALLAGCNAAFTAADTSQASAQTTAAPSAVAPATYSKAGADSGPSTEVAALAPDKTQRDGAQLEAEDLGSVMWVAEDHSASPASTASHSDGIKRSPVRLTASDLDSLL